MAKAEDLIQKAKVQLVLHHPFFASTAFKRPLTISEEKPRRGVDTRTGQECDVPFTACVDMQGRITMGRYFVESLSVPRVVFLLAHESMHHILMHSARRKWRKHRAFNQACDKVINDILISSGVGEPPAEGCYQAGAREFTAEQLYTEPPEDESGYAPGTGADDLSEAGAPKTEAEAQELEEQVRQELAQAVQAAKTVGKMPAGLERICDEIINPPTPWHVLLERFMTAYINAGTTWSRPNKRLLETAYFPSHNKKPTIGTVAIIGDSSGSIGAKEVSHFVGHMNKILESCLPEKVFFLHVDAMVHQVDEFTQDDLPLNIKTIKGGGGTDMGAGIRWLQEQGVDPDVCVILTDGFTPWPETPPDFPVAILCTTDKACPFGEVIRYRIEEN